MGAAFRRQRNARRRRHHDEAGVLITGIVQCIEAAGDERIIQRADRQQPLAVDAVRQPERGQQDKQIHLGDAELDMLAARGKLPGEGRGNALALEGVGHRLAREQAAAIDPGPEIGRHGDVGRRGDDARGKLARLAPDLIEQRTEPDLRRHGRLDRHRKLVGHGNVRRLQAALAAGRERHTAQKFLHRFGLAQTFERIPFVAWANVQGLAEGFHLRRRH
jgi:hypothetical protein